MRYIVAISIINAIFEQRPWCNALLFILLSFHHCNYICTIDNQAKHYFSYSKVQVEGLDNDVVTVTWECQEELVWIIGFEVKWRKEGKTEWSSETVNSKKLTLTDLACGEYQLSVCCLYAPGRGPTKNKSFLVQQGR